MTPVGSALPAPAFARQAGLCRALAAPRKVALCDAAAFALDAGAADLPTLRLTLWQGGDASELLLARAHPHGSFVQWHA